MHNIKKLYKHKKGDTIVEVLMCIAIMSLILTISYSLSNRNSAYIRQSQERGEAQKISEEQLELLRDYLSPETDWAGEGYQCFDQSNQPTEDSNDCEGKGDSKLYKSIISVTDEDTYTVSTTWASLTSTPEQSVELSYKLPASLLSPDQFILPPGSTVTLAAKKIPQRAPDGSLVSSAGTANPSCSDAGRVDKAGTTVSARYVGIDGAPGPWQSGGTDSNSTSIFTGFQHYGQYEAKVNEELLPTNYIVCGQSSKQGQLLRPDTNIDFDFVIKPRCTVATEIIGHTPVYAEGGYWNPNYGWIHTGGYWNFDGYWDTGYWPPGHGPVNNPATVFEAPGSRLELSSVNWDGTNYHHWYRHYHWANTYTWGVVSHTWVTYTYLHHYDPVYGSVNRCPA